MKETRAIKAVLNEEPTAVIYLRVSTPNQVKTDYDPEGISLPAQREACLRKAAQLGVRVIQEYVEPGRSATSMDKRPAFQAMLERIRTQRDVDYVIVYKLSRMNRNRLDDALVLASLRKYKTTLVSATESIDATPVGQLMHGILAAFNEYRSAEDGADIRYKMAAKARKGGTLGRAPLGYLNVRERIDGREIRTVIPDPDRAPYVTLAFELYATGNYTLEHLADELTTRGLRTNPGRYGTGPVSDSKLAVLLRDRYYLGIITHDDAEYPGRHQPLVTEDLFDHVQTILEASAVSGERRRRHDHHLKGSIWCARCHTRGTRGRLIYTRATGRHGTRYDYFTCRNRSTGTCDLPHLPIDHVEDAVTRAWTRHHLPASFITVVRDLMDDVLADTQTSTRLQHEQLTTQLAALQRQEANLIDLAADGALDSAAVRTRLTRISTERTKIQNRLAGTTDHLAAGAAVLHAQLDLLTNPGDLYPRLTGHGRRLINQAVFDQILIDAIPDPTDPTWQQINATGQTWHPDIHDLITLADTHNNRPDQADPAQNAEEPADDGGPSAGHPACIEQDRGLNKPAMVELRGFEPLTPSMP